VKALERHGLGHAGGVIVERDLCELCDRRPAVIALVLKKDYVISACAPCAAAFADDGVDLEPEDESQEPRP
jgi:hypothetical protein